MQGPRTIQTAHRVIQGIEAATLYQEIGQTEGGTGLAQKKLPVGNEALRKLMEPGNTAGVVRKNPIPDNICCFLNDFADCAILSACPLLMSFGNYWELSLVSSWIY